MRVKAYLLSLLAVLLALASILVPVPVLAIADPDDIQIFSVYVYEDCLETGDVGVMVHYLIDYAALPTETATEAYMAIFLDTDGATHLAAVAPYTYVDSGYGQGVIWIYFSASDVVTHGLDRTNLSLYRVRLSGNPTVPSGWAGDPPAISTVIDYWQETGDTAVLVALRVLAMADHLELIWLLDLVESTPLGNKLTTLGEEYFTNVITDLRTIAPNAFAEGTIDPEYPDIDFTQQFGAAMTNLSGNVTGSPIELTEGETTVNVTVAGTFTMELEQGTVGNVTGTVGGGTETLTGDPVSLVAGTSTVETSTTGTLVVNVWLNTTQQILIDTVEGTAFDLTDVATHFGMSRMWMSSIVWFIVTILVCAAVYKKASAQAPSGASKVTFLVFNVMFIGGILLSMLPLVVGVLLFLASDVFIGYILFFRGANV